MVAYRVKLILQNTIISIYQRLILLEKTVYISKDCYEVWNWHRIDTLKDTMEELFLYNSNVQPE